MNLRDLMNKLDRINEAEDPTAVIAKYAEMGKSPNVSMPAFIDPKDGKVKYIDPSTAQFGQPGQAKVMPSDWIQKYAPDLAAAIAAVSGSSKAAYGKQQKTGLFGIDGLGSFDDGTSVNVGQAGVDARQAAFIKSQLGKLTDLLNQLKATKPGSGNTDPAVGKVDYSIKAPSSGTGPKVEEGFELNETGSVTLTRHDGSQITFDPETLLVLEDSSVSGKLLESFAYTQYITESELAEYSWDEFKGDVGDTARGAWQGVTLGTGNNIAAGLKSAFGPGTYKDELAKQVSADKASQERSPWLYGGGNLAGALAMPVPGGALAAGIRNPLARGAAHAGLNIAAQSLIDKGVNKANKATLGYDPSKYPTSKEEIKAFQQANGLTPDGIIGPKTTAVLTKFGLKPETVAESIARLSSMLTMLESSNPETYWFMENGTVVNESGDVITDESVLQDIEWQDNLDEAWYSGLGNLASKGWDALSKIGRGAAFGAKNPELAAKLSTKPGSNLTNKIATNAAKTTGAIARNPGKAALATGAAAATLGGLGDPNASGQTTKPPASHGKKPGSGQATKPETPATPDAPATPEGPTLVQKELIAQIQAVMSQLHDIQDPEVQKAIKDANDVITSFGVAATDAKPGSGADAANKAAAQLAATSAKMDQLMPSNATANTTGGPNMGQVNK